MGRGFTGRAEGRAHKTATEPMPERRGRPDSFPLSTYSAPGDLRQDPGRAAESLAEARTYGNGSREMRVLLTTYGSRGDATKDCEGSGQNGRRRDHRGRRPDRPDAARGPAPGRSATAGTGTQAADPSHPEGRRSHRAAPELLR